MSQQFPLVTFALFAYNQERYIRAAVEAALAQDYPNLEILLSDDASTDATFGLMQEAVAGYRGPHRVRLNRNQQNLGRGGIGAHVNRVLQLARGEFVVMAGGDDISFPNRVSALLAAWERTEFKAGLVHSAVELMTETGEVVKTVQGRASYAGLDVAGMLAAGAKGVLGASVGIARRLQLRFGELDPHAYFEDRIFAFRAFLDGGIAYVPRPLLRYRAHGGAMSGSAIYTDPAKWNHWMEGMLDAHAHFWRDYQTACNGTEDKRVKTRWHRELRRIETARLVQHPHPVLRLYGAWVYARDERLRARLGFALARAGWLDATPVRRLRSIMRSLG